VTGGSTPTVLVVDDTSDIRLLMVTLLRQAGIAVEEAVDGMAAIRSVQRQVPELIVLDLQMPQLDGWMTLAELRKVVPAEVPVVVCSVKSAEADRMRALELGCDGFITKPFANDHFVWQVQQLLATDARDRPRQRAQRVLDPDRERPPPG
jgi:DNA-binding response OmpR family regulator